MTEEGWRRGSTEVRSRQLRYCALASLRENEARYNVACSKTMFDRVPWTLTRVVRYRNVRGVYVVRI